MHDTLFIDIFQWTLTFILNWKSNLNEKMINEEIDVDFFFSFQT
jgi:hypothetical protein